jgi:hypothetical protein
LPKTTQYLSKTDQKSLHPRVKHPFFTWLASSRRSVSQTLKPHAACQEFLTENPLYFVHLWRACVRAKIKTLADLLPWSDAA